MDKSNSAYKTIGEVAKILSLKLNNKGVLSTHVIRFWETQFKQIKPKILNSNRRYYDEKTIDLLKKIKFLLKDQGMTINGVKKILNNQASLKLDEIADKSIRTENLRIKLLKISNKLKELKNAMTGTLIGKISSLLNISNLKKFKKRLDPRLYNGAIFIGLDSPVVKSHGGTDYIGFSNSLDVCHRIVKGNLIEKIKQNI